MGWKDDPVVENSWRDDPVIDSATTAAPAAAPASAQPAGASPASWLMREIRGLPQAMPRAAGLAARSVVDAAIGIPGMMADAATDLGNRMTGKTPWNALTVPSAGMPSYETGKLLDRALPKPETGVERATSFVTGALTGAKLPQMAAPSKYATPEGFKGYAMKTATEDTFAKAREAGYVIPPSALKPNALTINSESMAGKAAIKQSAQIKNQEVTDRLIKKGLGIGKNETVTPVKFKEIRQTAGKVYGEVEKIGGNVFAGKDNQYIDDIVALGKGADELAAEFPGANVGKSKEVQELADSLLQEKFTTKAAIEYAKELRKQASGNLSFANIQDPAKRALGYAQRDGSAALEESVMRNLSSQGRGDLAKKFNDARVMIAKSHSAEAAFNESTGHFIAEGFSSQLKRGKPLSGEFRQVANFNSAFRQFGGAPGGGAMTSPGVSALDYAMALGGGAAGAAVAGGPVGAAAALAIPAARMTARYGLLSNPVQNSLIPRPAAGPIRPELFGGGLGGLLAQ